MWSGRPWKKRKRKKKHKQPYLIITEKPANHSGQKYHLFIPRWFLFKVSLQSVWVLRPFCCRWSLLPFIFPDSFQTQGLAYSHSLDFPGKARVTARNKNKNRVWPLTETKTEQGLIHWKLSELKSLRRAVRSLETNKQTKKPHYGRTATYWWCGPKTPSVESRHQSSTRNSHI